MLTFFLADINLPYTIAISIVFLFAIIELFGLLIGLSLLDIFDNLSPLAIDSDASLDISPGGLLNAFDWLCINRLPMLIWLILCLTQFSIAGFTVNYLAFSVFDWQLSLYISLPIALIIAAFLTHFFGGLLVNIFPKESAAISSSTFTGKLAKITIGTASKGNPAEAVFTDEHNQKHYLMVEPGYEHVIFTQGTEVVIVEKLATSWLAIPFN